MILLLWLANKTISRIYRSTPNTTEGDFHKPNRPGGFHEARRNDQRNPPDCRPTNPALTYRGKLIALALPTVRISTAGSWRNQQPGELE